MMARRVAKSALLFYIHNYSQPEAAENGRNPAAARQGLRGPEPIERRQEETA